MEDHTVYMIKQAKLALSRAYAPYSSFPVGACVRTTEGQFFIGCNVENACYALGHCAEATAIANMVAGGFQRIAEIVIVSQAQEICPPCGSCRQWIAEFSDASTKVHLCVDNHIKATFSIAELLPLAFTLTT